MSKKASLSDPILESEEWKPSYWYWPVANVSAGVTMICITLDNIGYQWASYIALVGLIIFVSLLYYGLSRFATSSGRVGLLIILAIVVLMIGLGLFN